MRPRKTASRPARRPAPDPGASRFSAEGLRLRRAVAGLTLAELAERVSELAGVPVALQRVSEWERGSAAPDPRVVALLARALSCSVDDLARTPRLQ